METSGQRRIELGVALIAVMLSFFSPTAQAGDEDFQRPAPTARWKYDANACQAQFKRMETLLRLWASGKALATDVLDRPDNQYWAGALPFWAYKNQDIAMRESFGDLYFNGCPKAGKEPDTSAALEMYERSALNHSPSAQFKFGRMLREGIGTPKSEDAGLAWISSAAIEGSSEAADYLTNLGIEAPKPMWPNSYALAAIEAKEVFDGHRQAERAEIVHDLASLAVGIATTYVKAQTSMSSSSPTPRIRPSSSVAAQPASFRPYVMTKPVFCNYQATVMNHSGGNTAYVYVTAFCN